MALGLSVDLVYGVEVNDVIKVNGSEVDLGMLFFIGVLDGDVYFYVVRRLGIIVIFLFLYYVFCGGRSRVVVIAANWSEGFCRREIEERVRVSKNEIELCFIIR